MSQPADQRIRARGRGVIEHYRDYLPVSDSTPIISLGEGDTPLIYSPRLSGRVGRGCEVFVKYEGLNPTGSFKDRGMTVAVSKAIEQRAQTLICASTGNTSASAAAYAARAGIRCAVVLPAGKIASGKLLQAFVYGAKIVAIDGNFDDALRIVRELGERAEFLHRQLDQSRPHRRTKNGGVRDCRCARGRAPTFISCRSATPETSPPTGPAIANTDPETNQTQSPAMIGFQAAGAAPIFHDRIMENPETIASAIRIGNPASWKQARAAIKESSGAIDIVTDEEILEAQTWLARNEGIFVEPASAASIAGFFKCCRTDAAAYPFAKIAEGSRIVCTVTGHGLKDPDVLAAKVPEIKPVPATVEAVDPSDRFLDRI